MKKVNSFKGGIALDYHKDISTRLPIIDAELPEYVVIPFQQATGTQATPVVKVGQKVLKGQLIGEASDFQSVGIHASTSGIVQNISTHPIPHPSGLGALCCTIKADGQDKSIEFSPPQWQSMKKTAVLEYLQCSGIAGLGGAVFPTHLKIETRSTTKTIIINGAECEPYITCDDMQMREESKEILSGAHILATLLGAEKIIIGIEDNKPQAIQSMQNTVDDLGLQDTEVVSIPSIYPAGGAKQLIKTLTGIAIPHGRRSTDFGVQCFNTGTAKAIHDALVLGKPLFERIVTITGDVRNPRNYRVRLGTLMNDIILASSPKTQDYILIMGGPMMGYRMPIKDIPVVKATNCILVGSKSLLAKTQPEMPCIRCGRCAEVCPVDLSPLDLYWFSRAKQFGQAQEYHLFDCIECGCCAYVCPSNIPLVDYYRFAKDEIWSRERQKNSANAARNRYEFHLLREETAKKEKEERLKARAAKLNNPNS